MSLSQNLNEFRFNLETLDLMTSMGRTTEQATAMLTEVGFNQQLVQFMVSQRNILNMVLLRLQLYSEQNTSEVKVRSGLAGLNNPSVHTLLDYLFNCFVFKNNLHILLLPILYKQLLFHQFVINDQKQKSKLKIHKLFILMV
jgi:hypothetical protein